jgi:site-specific DNA-methyltransferase (adenine-specific)
VSVRLEHGDMLAILPTLGQRFHAVVTDPPYGLNFMGRKWDKDIAFQRDTWALVGSVMLPGAHLVAFAGTKGAHRMACAIEDAGFEIRDTLAWLYGSGFPKSHNVSKAMDRAAGAEREVVGAHPAPAASLGANGIYGNAGKDAWRDTIKARSVSLTAPATDAAREWEGWGTALKPAYEPIVLARWPMSAKTVAANLAEHRCGAINVDACRIGTEGGSTIASGVDRLNAANAAQGYRPGTYQKGLAEPPAPNGRWPANVVHDGSEEVLAAFPDSNVSGSAKNGGRSDARPVGMFGAKAQGTLHNDSGSAARFFYSAKADAGDRLASRHPTVKPVDLMRWLVRLVTPMGGHVLDPFAGSGTTGMACMAEGFDCTLIEREAEYAADIRRRIAHVSGDDTPLFKAAD